MPRRTRSSTQTTAIRRPIKRASPTEETPTLPLTPVEVESLVQGATATGAVPPDANTRLTVVNFRPALGSASLPAVAKPVPHAAAGSASIPAAGTGAPFELPPLPPVHVQPAVSPPIATPAPTTSPAPATRGPRRTRQTLRADAVKLPPLPPNRKR